MTQTSYWKEHLAGAPTKLELPTDKPRPAVQSLRRANESFTLPKGMLEQLKEIGRQEQATLLMTLGAGFMVLLHRYTGQNDILVGVPILTGSRVNTVVLRSHFSDELSFRSLLKQVRERALAAHAHADVPFEKVVAELVPERDPSHAPLCQVMFALDNASTPSLDTETAQCDLTLFISETATGLDGSIAYSTDLFEARTIQRMGGHYGALLSAIAHDPDQRTCTLPMLTERERAQLLYEWNDTHSSFPDTCAHRLFEQRAALEPDATAVVFEDVRLSYRQLNERANQVAHYLRNRGIGPEVLVGVCLERCPDLVIALLGVWKAGGAYVPLDPSNPSDRLAYMLKDAAAKVLLTNAKNRHLFPSEEDDAICVDSEWPSIEKESTVNLDSTVIPSNLAYVMYTSGSTGQPKGAMVLHRGLVNYLCWAAAAYAAGSGDAVPVHTSIAFDLTVTALYTPLVAGGRVEILSEDVGGQKIVAALRAGNERSLVKITPAHLALLGEQFRPSEAAGRTKLFVIGGENLLAESLLLWRDHAPSTRLINEYGPTETVVGCCIYEVRADDPRSGSVPIGRPIANTQLYILDRHRNPLPLGLIGELYIGGAGVARGYLNRPELTAERFLPDPFSKEIGARLYRTGDLARYRMDGTLEYLGRVDNQVKVRGYRIELGEIEATLADHPGVKSCAVLAREDSPGNKQLVGYVVARDDAPPSPDQLREFLGAKLPEYMVPPQFVFLDAMPLTTNGKVDRKGLPAPSPPKSASAAGGRVAPRTTTEKALLTIWIELLGVESIGVDDNFFELGGHSLLAMKAVSRIREVLGVELSPQALFDEATIGGLARLVTESTGEAGTAVAQAGPFFFGEPQLFGVYYPAHSENVRESALLVCPSIGHEYTRGHRAIKLLCEATARAGFPTLRFDYTGVGDSAGDFASAGVDVWCNDVVRALDELRGRVAGHEIHVVGFRLGAALAAAALRRAGVNAARFVKSLCLWDPLLSGEEFLEVASAFQELFVRDPGRFTPKTLRGRSGSAGDLLLGYSFPEAMRSSLVDLDLRRIEAWPPVAIRAVLSEPSASCEDLATRLREAGRRIALEPVTGAEGAWADYARHEKTLRAGPVIARIVDQLAGKRS